MAVLVEVVEETAADFAGTHPAIVSRLFASGAGEWLSIAGTHVMTEPVDSTTDQRPLNREARGWWAYAGPFVLFGLFTMLEGSAPASRYPALYAAKVVAVTASTGVRRPRSQGHRPYPTASP